LLRLAVRTVAGFAVSKSKIGQREVRSMDLGSLDAKLRERAQRKLRDKVNTAFGDLRSALKDLSGREYSPLWKDSGLRPTEHPEWQRNIGEVLEFVQEVLVKAATAEWEQREIDAFIADLDKLKVSVEELAARTE
jgi:hypothetical protein